MIERGRFRCEDAVRARQHARAQDSDVDPALFTETLPTLEQNALGFTAGSSFPEIPQDLLQTEDWQFVWSHPWQCKENILRTEARALFVVVRSAHASKV